MNLEFASLKRKVVIKKTILGLLGVAIAAGALTSCEKLTESFKTKPTDSQSSPNSAKIKFTTTELTGKFVINPQFDEAYSFREGLAAVKVGDEKTGKWGFIDTNGNFAIPPQFDLAGGFYEGLARVGIGQLPNIKWGYVDKNGRMKVIPQFSSAGNFSDGLALVSAGNTFPRKYGYMDMGGNLITKPEFANPSNFSEGLAAVSYSYTEEANYGYVDKKGVVAINTRSNPSLALLLNAPVQRSTHANLVMTFSRQNNI